MQSYRQIRFGCTRGHGMGSRARRGARLALVLGALASAACASLEPPPAAPSDADARYRIGTSDEIAYRILPDPVIVGTTKVRPDGHISVDLIGDVDAAGRTAEEIAREIEQRIARYRLEPLVTVSVAEANSATVDVLGEVVRPGRYPIAQETRLADAIALASGATHLAAASRVRLVRGAGDQATAYEADLDAIQAGEGGTNVVLAPGDVIYVPPATPVAVGYAIRRALYPLEALLSSITGGLAYAFAGGN